MLDRNEFIKKAYKFKFSYEHVFFFVDCPENDDIQLWLEQHIKGNWEYYRIDEGGAINVKVDYLKRIIEPVMLICIESDEEAALFRLTWI